MQVALAPNLSRRLATSALALFAALVVSQAPLNAHINEQVKLVPGDGSPGDRFGTDVDLDGDLAVVGAPGDDDQGSGSGSAYVFRRNGATWDFEAKLLPPATAPNLRFGTSVSIDEGPNGTGTIVVGAPDSALASTQPGTAYVFVRSAQTWSLEATLSPSDGAALDAFGQNVAIHGETVVIGSPNHDTGAAADSGAAYVYLRTGTVWAEEGKLTATDADAGDHFGLAVAVLGDRVAIGAPDDSGVASLAGAAYIFDRAATVWSETIKLTDPFFGAGDRFATDLGLSPDQVVIGSPLKDSVGIDTGSLIFFHIVASNWVYRSSISAPGAEDDDQLGASIAVEDKLNLAGMHLDDSSTAVDVGSGLLLVDEGGTIDAEVLVASDATPGDELGRSVGVSGCWGIVGTTKADVFGDDSGAAYVYVLAHAPVNYCVAGTSANGCTPTLSVSGFPSASAPSGFTIRADAVEGAKDGLFFFGTNGRQSNPWGNGSSFQCVIPPLARGGLLTGIGTQGMCNGRMIQDLNALWCPTCPKPAKNPGPGAVVQAQLWYRDPQNTSNQTTSLSDAIEFELCP